MVESMNLRSEKYDDENKEVLSRTSKNEKLYSSMDEVDLSRIKTNTNVSVISEATKQIDIEKIKRYIESENSEDKFSRTIIESPDIKQEKIIEAEEKDYDILSILNRAKSNRVNQDYIEQRHRKIDEIDLDILKNLNLNENENVSETDEKLNTEEKTIVDLIHNMAAKSNKTDDLFDELMNGNDDTKVLAINNELIEEKEKENEIKQTKLEKEEKILDDLETISKEEPKKTGELISEAEYEKMCMKAVKGKKLTTEEFTKMEEFDKHHYNKNVKNDTVKVEKIEPKPNNIMPGVDKSFFTNSMSFNKGDFEGFDEMEKKVKKSGALMKISIIIMLLVLIATIVVVLNYVFSFGWF